MRPCLASYTTPEPTSWTSRVSRRLVFGSWVVTRPLISILTTAGVIFRSTGASDSVPLAGGATGGGMSASAAEVPPRP